MRLKDAARRFNTALALDAYTGDELFRCAFTSFDDHAASGATARRRVLSVPEGTEIPVRSAIDLFTEIWLVGSGSADSYAGEIIRESYGMRRASDLARLGSPASTILDTTTTFAYVQKQFFKDTYDTQTEADSNISWNIFVSPIEAVPDGSFIVTSDRTFRVRKSYLPIEGLRVCECDELESDAAQTAVFSSNGNYDPATDSYTTTSIAVSVLVIDYNRLYRLHTAADAPYVPGDEAVLVPKTSITPVVGAKFGMLGITWRVLTVQSELDCWLMHVRIG